MMTTTTQPAKVINIPPGMSVVTREAFFQFLHNDPRDIMPTAREREFSAWETKRGEVVGITVPGWGNGWIDDGAGGIVEHPKLYMLNGK